MENKKENEKETQHTQDKLSYEVPQGTYKEGQKVSILVKIKNELGYKVVVENKYWGILYHNEVFQHLRKDQETHAYVKKIREDGRLDLILYKPGNLGAQDIGQKILETLEAFDGYLNITSQTDPEDIYQLFGVSKKKFKIAIGGLYKKRLIDIKEDGIYLLNSKQL